jgi:hypothetical protein
MCDRDNALATSCLYVDMEVDDFAIFVFEKNINNALIDLSLGGVENNKDLFFFLVDLMCKGLVILFGNNKKLELDTITSNDFGFIKSKLALAGIKIMLNVIENIENIPSNVNIRELDYYPDDIPLNEFTFKVTTMDLIYEITFELSH